jgi:hypothetical protein
VTSFLPTSSPSFVSSRLGHPRRHWNWARTLGRTQHLEASRSIFSSRYMQNRHQQKPMQTCIFFRRHCHQNPQARHHRFGGAERDRTADPLLAKQVLSQLSYSPSSSITGAFPLRLRQQSAPSIPINSQSIIHICKWWAREDLNFRPHAYQACALTN